MSSNPFSHAYFKTLLLHLILTSITGVLNLAPCCRVIVQTFARLQHKSHFFLCSLSAFFFLCGFRLIDNPSWQSCNQYFIIIIVIIITSLWLFAQPHIDG